MPRIFDNIEKLLFSADQIEVHEPEAEYGNPKENGK